MAAWAGAAVASGVVLRWALQRDLLNALAPRLAVEGTSMAPTLLPGDRLLVAPRLVARPRLGDLVAFADPRGGAAILVKRVAAIEEAGIWVEGDNRQHSTDSRDFGPVPHSRILGRVVYRYAPLTRSGPIPGQR